MFKGSVLHLFFPFIHIYVHPVKCIYTVNDAYLLSAVALFRDIIIIIIMIDDDVVWIVCNIYILYENRFILSIVIINILSFPLVIILRTQEVSWTGQVNRRERKKSRRRRKSAFNSLIWPSRSQQSELIKAACFFLTHHRIELIKKKTRPHFIKDIFSFLDMLWPILFSSSLVLLLVQDY